MKGIKFNLITPWVHRSIIRPLLLSFVIVSLTAAAAMAGGFSHAKPAKGYANVAGGAISGGFGLDNDTWLWGVAADYSRQLTGKWSLNTSLNFDRETESKPDRDTVTDSFSVVIAAGYSLTDKLSLGAGFGHGFLTREHNGGKWNSPKLGDDLATGVSLSYTFWQKGRLDFSPSTSLEYNIEERVWSLTFDLGLGYSF